MALTLESAARLLDRHGLLREIIRGDVWTLDPHDIKGFDEPFSAITYDTRKVEPGTFLCCKGRFKAEYLQGIDERGLAAYVSENDFSDATQAPGLIVDDVRKAMALLSAEFYGRPQDQLKVSASPAPKARPPPPISRRRCSMAVPAASARCFPPWTIVLTATPTWNPI